MTLVDSLAQARSLAERGGSPQEAAAVLERVVLAAADTESVREALRSVPRGRALLRFTDSEDAFEFGAGEGTLMIARAERRGPGPKVDATSATWLGLMGGTLKPWLAFTRGLVVCRAGLNELRWLQQVAERMQQGYAQAR